MKLRSMWPAAIAAIVLTGASAALAQEGNRAMGRVTAVTGNKVTVVGFRDTTPVTFTVSGTTKYQVSVTVQANDLKVGDNVFVMGRPSEDDDNTIEARRIMIIPAGTEFAVMGGGRRPGGNPAGAGGGPGGGGPGGGGPGGGRGRFGVRGTVATLTPAITVTTDDGTKVIDTDPDTTTYSTMKSGGLTDVAVGKMVMAQLNGSNVATQVQVMPAMGRRGGGGGWRGGGGPGGGGPGAGGPPPPGGGGDQ